MEEIFKDIIDYEGVYQISNYGNVKSLRRYIATTKGRFTKEKFLKKKLNKFGYYTCALYKDNIRKEFFVHCLVALHFIFNFENKPQVNHIDGVKTNNYVDNLEWVTCSENQKYAHKLGLKNQKGEKNNASKLCWEDIIKINLLIKENISDLQIAKLFGVSDTCIYKIRHKKIWGN